MIPSNDKLSQVIQFFKKETTDEECLNKMIDALILERLHYESMAFKYYRATLAGAKGMKRQAAKIKRLESTILDIEFANQYRDGNQVNKVEVINE